MRIAALIFVLIAVARIVSTYGTFNNTCDEAHFAAGLEWLADGAYTYEYQHPPLARVVLALGPFAAGVRPQHLVSIWDEANHELAQGGRYWHNLTLARLGVLPFFLLACWVLWKWTKELYGEAAALAALGLFTFLPPILAHSGLATLDIACMATVLWASHSWFRFLRFPGYVSGALLGLSVGAAVLTKFSALLFLPVIGLVLLSAEYCRARANQAAAETVVGRRWNDRLGATASCQRGGSVPAKSDRLVGSATPFVVGSLVAFATCFFSIQLLYRGDLHGFFDGIGQVIAHNRAGHDSWLLGKYSSQGWWYFFPVVLAVKTPLGFIALALLGTLRARLAAVSALGILLVCLPAHINLGVRHILVIYPFLAMMAGAGLVFIWDWSSERVMLDPEHRIGLWAASVTAGWFLLAWIATSSIAHPDYLAYFNEIPQHQNYTLAESDLDWGQDLQRLSAKLKEFGTVTKSICDGEWCIPEPLYVNYFGSADVSQFHLPPFQRLEGWKPVKGWIAISTHVQTIEAAALKQTYGAPTGPLDWLDDYQPVAMAGKSIKIYHVE